MVAQLSIATQDACALQPAGKNLTGTAHEAEKASKAVYSLLKGHNLKVGKIYTCSQVNKGIKKKNSSLTMLLC